MTGAFTQCVPLLGRNGKSAEPVGACLGLVYARGIMMKRQPALLTYAVRANSRPSQTLRHCARSVYPHSRSRERGARGVGTIERSGASPRGQKLSSARRTDTVTTSDAGGGLREIPYSCGLPRPRIWWCSLATSTGFVIDWPLAVFVRAAEPRGGLLPPAATMIRALVLSGISSPTSLSWRR